MSVSGVSSSGTYSSGGGSGGSGDGTGSNYNYLSFFARGSYGRKLEAQKSRDPTLARFEEEKKLWKWIAGVALAFMTLTNVLMAVGLVIWKYQVKAGEVEFTGNLYESINQDMKNRLRADCRPKYRKSPECSQIAAQMFLVASAKRDQVVWSDKQKFPNYDLSSLGAFECPEKSDLSHPDVGRFHIQEESFYQIHSHLQFHHLPNGSKLEHAIIREHLHSPIILAQENITTKIEGCQIRRSAQVASVDGGCFSSSILATDVLKKNDIISIQLKVDNQVVDPKEFDKVDLVYDGKSSYFGIVKLGKLKKSRAYN